MKCYIVTMVDTTGGPPWSAAFSSRERAHAYADELRHKISKAHLQHRFVIDIESGIINDWSYANCFEDVFVKED